MLWKCGRQSLAGLILKRTAVFIMDRAGRRDVNVLQRIAEYVRYMKRYAQELDSPGDPRWSDAPSLTVILNSFRRPENMPWLVAGLLVLPYVRTVLILNNNPTINLGGYFGKTEPRVEIRDMLEPTLPIVRFNAAVHMDGEFFLSVDDDVLLRPRQIHALFLAMLANRRVPHGILGERVTSVSPLVLERVNPQSADEPVDILLRAYFFSKALLHTLQNLKDWATAHGFNPGPCDDILLSFSGTSKPRVHAVGPWVNCLSSGHRRVALFRRIRDFNEIRGALLEALWKRENRGACRQPVAADVGRAAGKAQ